MKTISVARYLITIEGDKERQKVVSKEIDRLLLPYKTKLQYIDGWVGSEEVLLGMPTATKEEGEEDERK